jgi:acetyl-CoA carboxylase carboxyltransferase component
VSSGEERYPPGTRPIEQGHDKYRDKLRAEGKLFVRDPPQAPPRSRHEFQEDWLFARNQEPTRPPTAWSPASARSAGRTVCIMANDYTVKAGSWGEKTVAEDRAHPEKAARLRIPLLYLVDAAGGRISEQIKIFPGGSTPAASSTTRSSSPASCRRSASCSGPRRPGRRTCPR